MYQDDYSEKIFSRRAFFIGAIQLVGLSILGARLAWLQIAQGKRYKTLSDKNRIDIKMISPLRGQIVDRFGVPLAVNTQNYRVLIVPEQVDDLEKSLHALHRIVPIEERHVKRVLKEAKRTAKFIPIKVKEDLTWSEVAKIEVNLPDLPGLSIDTGDVRNYPYRDSTAHVIGYVRSASVRDLEKDNDPMLKLPGFKIGKTGIEKVYEAELRGKAGASEVEVNVVGREVRELKRKPSLSGARVTLTLDGELQRFTQETLKKHKSASAVIMDAQTGAIYAMASHPSFDPNSFVRGLSQEEWQIIRDDPALPQNNKAIAGQYPPGSTFKMITALAALEKGVVNRNTTVFCPGHYEYGRDKFHCWKKQGHGTVDLVQALEQSCDTYFYKLATEVGIDAIADMSRRFGLGSKLDFELTEEKSGLIPDKKWKRANFRERWQPGESIVASIGQGYIQTTPLQLAVMTARLVNGGHAVKPWITGYLGDEFLGREQWDKMDIPKAHLDLVKKGMEAVVNSKKGTARKSRIEEQGWLMGGKTGTAQVRRITKEQRRLGVKNEDLPWEQRHHALFVGYAPIDRPRYVCSVVVEHGVGGSSAAAPLAKELMLQAQARDPAVTQMQPEIIQSSDVLQVRPLKKPLFKGERAKE
ncbi:MAG: penicillin-binding protein 2 [Alphaproteobacteria bacterium]